MQNIIRRSHILSPCPTCGGEGQFANEHGSPRCPTCDGHGQVELRNSHQKTEPVQDKRKKEER